MLFIIILLIVAAIVYLLPKSKPGADPRFSTLEQYICYHNPQTSQDVEWLETQYATQRRAPYPF